RVGKQLDVISATFFNLDAAETNDYLQQLAQELSPLLAEYNNDIMLNEALFHRVKHVYEHADRSALTAEENRLLEKTYKSCVRNGALLSEAEKARLRDIDQELATLTMKFSQHVLQETNAYQLHIQEQSDLAGLPDSIVEAA